MNSSANVLIALLGNRDLQFKDPENLNEWFEANNDDREYLIISKANKKKSFYEISEDIYRNKWVTLASRAAFPLIESSIKQIGVTDTLVLVSSHQSPPDTQDTHYIGEIARKYFIEKQIAKVETCSFDSNPTDLSALINYFLQLYGKYSEAKIFVANSGGTPDMRAASYFAGVFKNIEFITVNARTKKASQTNFKQHEKAILEQIIQKMLNVYEYGGIYNLPVSKSIRSLCSKALDHYNLNSDITDTLTSNYKESAEKAIELLINNLIVCYEQGRYADVIGRIFRIEEGMMQYLFYCELENKGLLDENGNYRYKSEKSPGGIKKVKFKILLKQFIPKLISNEYLDLVVKDEKSGEYFFKAFPKVNIESGKNFFYFFYRSQNLYRDVCDFFANLNSGYDQNSNKLQELRNNSIVGHGFKGVAENDILQISGPFDQFTKKLITLYSDTCNREFNYIFKNFNEEILASLREG